MLKKYYTEVQYIKQETQWLWLKQMWGSSWPKPCSLGLSLKDFPRALWIGGTHFEITAIDSPPGQNGDVDDKTPSTNSKSSLGEATTAQRNSTMGILAV